MYDSLWLSLWSTLALSLAHLRTFWLPLALSLVFSGARWLTRSLLGSPHRGRVATVYPSLTIRVIYCAGVELFCVSHRFWTLASIFALGVLHKLRCQFWGP